MANDNSSPPKLELYDLLADPGETRDLAAISPNVVKRLQTQLKTWLESCARSDRGDDY